MPRNEALLSLSLLIRDPRVRAAFERAERDQGGALQIPAVQPRPQTLPNGATVVLEIADAA
jgi:hypothetical protein